MKTLISHGRGSKNHNFTEVRIPLLFGSILGGHFGANISLKWRLASPCAALGSYLDRFWGVRKFVLNKFYGNGWKRMETDGTGQETKSSQRSKSIYPTSHMIRSSLSIYLSIYLSILYVYICIYIYIYRRSNHMTCRIDRL